MAAESDNPSQIIRVSECKWEPMSATIKFKTLWSDPASKRRAQLTRFEPGAVLPMHRHIGDEFLYVVEGAISDESGVTAAGSVGYRPNGCVHSVASATGATVFAIISGGIESASAIGDAPPSQTIVLSDIAWADAMPGVRQKPIWIDNRKYPQWRDGVGAGYRRRRNARVKRLSSGRRSELQSERNRSSSAFARTLLCKFELMYEATRRDSNKITRLASDGLLHRIEARAYCAASLRG